MCRLPQGPLCCLFNTCKHTPSISVSLFVLQRHTNVQQRDTVLTPLNLRKHVYFLKREPQVTTSSNHLIKNILLHLTAISSFDIKPITEQLICTPFFYFFISIQPWKGFIVPPDSFALDIQYHAAQQRSTIVHLRQIAWRYCSIGWR